MGRSGWGGLFGVGARDIRCRRCPPNVEPGHLLDSRLRLVSAILALVGIGLLLSLLPRTSFVARSANEIVDAVGPAWPEQSVEQVLDEGLDVVSEVRIWGAAGFGRGEAPVVAALLQGPDRELVRQVAVKIQPSQLMQPYVLEFPAYQPVPGEPLILQLWVSTERKNHAIFGTTEPGGEAGGATINLNPTDQGPLAYELIWRGDGWRAALEGSWLDRLRLAGGIGAAVVAVLLRPGVGRRLGKALGEARAAMLIVGTPIAGKLRLARRWLSAQDSRGSRASRRRVIYVYPWLIPAFAILHYLATNLFLLRAYEAIFPSAVIMAGVTVVFMALRVILNGVAPAALFTGIVGILFFSYGHIYLADWQQPDRRILLGLGVPILAGVGMLLRGRVEFSHRIGRVLNFGSIVLIAIPIFQLGLVLVTTTFQQDRNTGVLANPVMLDERLSESRATIPPEDLRDIYYIILDGYPRSGSPESFDNTSFVEELENRGFYVDPHARSNYTCSVWSITSSANMSYIRDAEPCAESLVETYKIYNAALDHALGRILTNLGYNYVHVSSGWRITATNLNADQIVEFTPQGRVFSEYQDNDPGSQYQYVGDRAFSLSNRFMSRFLTTTLVKASRRLSSFAEEDRFAYGYSDPSRVLAWLEYMKEVSFVESPKFVFAHLVKPHDPYSFDQYGNIALGEGWKDDHDPEVESAFHGQVIWLNARMLETIDAILGASNRMPIVVIMSDHGREKCRNAPICHDILAAYLLPEGGEIEFYPEMTSVNAFRLILNQYFDVGLETLEDRIFLSEG